MTSSRGVVRQRAQHVTDKKFGDTAKSSLTDIIDVSIADDIFEEEPTIDLPNQTAGITIHASATKKSTDIAEHLEIDVPIVFPSEDEEESNEDEPEDEEVVEQEDDGDDTSEESEDEEESDEEEPESEETVEHDDDEDDTSRNHETQEVVDDDKGNDDAAKDGGAPQKESMPEDGEEQTEDAVGDEEGLQAKKSKKVNNKRSISEDDDEQLGVADDDTSEDSEEQAVEDEEKSRRKKKAKEIRKDISEEDNSEEDDAISHPDRQDDGDVSEREAEFQKKLKDAIDKSENEIIRETVDYVLGKVPNAITSEKLDIVNQRKLDLQQSGAMFGRCNVCGRDTQVCSILSYEICPECIERMVGNGAAGRGHNAGFGNRDVYDSGLHRDPITGRLKSARSGQTNEWDTDDSYGSASMESGRFKDGQNYGRSSNDESFGSKIGDMLLGAAEKTIDQISGRSNSSVDVAGVPIAPGVYGGAGQMVLNAQGQLVPMSSLVGTTNPYGFVKDPVTGQLRPATSVAEGLSAGAAAAAVGAQAAPGVTGGAGQMVLNAQGQLVPLSSLAGTANPYGFVMDLVTKQLKPATNLTEGLGAGAAAAAAGAQIAPGVTGGAATGAGVDPLVLNAQGQLVPRSTLANTNAPNGYIQGPNGTLVPAPLGDAALAAAVNAAQMALANGTAQLGPGVDPMVLNAQGQLVPRSTLANTNAPNGYVPGPNGAMIPASPGNAGLSEALRAAQAVAAAGAAGEAGSAGQMVLNAQGQLVPMSSLAGTANPYGFVKDPTTGQLRPATSVAEGLSAGAAAAAAGGLNTTTGVAGAVNKVTGTANAITGSVNSVTTALSPLSSLAKGLSGLIPGGKTTSTASGTISGATGATSASGTTVAAGTSGAARAAGAAGATGTAGNVDLSSVSKKDVDKIRKLQKILDEMKAKAVIADNNVKSNELALRNAKEEMDEATKDAQNAKSTREKNKANSKKKSTQKEFDALNAKKEKLEKKLSDAQAAETAAKKNYDAAVAAAQHT